MNTALKQIETKKSSELAHAPTPLAPETWRVTGALIAVQVLFGVNYTVSKVLVDRFPALLWSSFRCTIAGCLLFAMAAMSKKRPPRLTLSFLAQATGLSLLAVVFNQA